MNVRRGAVTVYFSIIFLALSLLCMTVVDAARVEMARIDVQRAVDAAVYSISTEYDQELKDRYGLLAFDGSEVSEKFKFYLNANLPNEDSSLIANVYEVNIDESTISDSSATPINGQNAKNQILDYMKYRAPLMTLEPFIKKLGTIQTSSNTTDALKDKTEIVDNELKEFAELYEALREYISGWKMGTGGTPEASGKAYVNGFNNILIYTDAYLEDRGLSPISYGQDDATIANVFTELRNQTDGNVTISFQSFYAAYEAFYISANDLAYNQLAMDKSIDALYYGLIKPSVTELDSTVYGNVEAWEADKLGYYDDIRANNLEIHEEKLEDDQDDDYIDALRIENEGLIQDIANIDNKIINTLSQQGYVAYIYSAISDVNDHIYNSEVDILDYEDDIDDKWDEIDDLRDDKSDAETSEEKDAIDDDIDDLKDDIDDLEDDIDDLEDEIDDFEVVRATLYNDLSLLKNMTLEDYVLFDEYDDLEYAGRLLSGSSISYGEVVFSTFSDGALRTSVKAHVDKTKGYLDEYKETFNAMVYQASVLNGLYDEFSDVWFSTDSANTKSYIYANNHAIEKYIALKDKAEELKTSLTAYRDKTEGQINSGEILEDTGREIINEVEGHLRTLDKLTGELNNEDPAATSGLGLDIEGLCNNNLQIINTLRGTSGSRDYHFYFQIDVDKLGRYLKSVSDSDTPDWAYDLPVFDSVLSGDEKYTPAVDKTGFNSDLTFVELVDDTGYEYQALTSFVELRGLDTTDTRHESDIAVTYISDYANDIELDGEEQLEAAKDAEEMIIKEENAGTDTTGADGDGTSDGKATTDARALLDKLRSGIEELEKGEEKLPESSYTVTDDVRFSTQVEIASTTNEEGETVSTAEANYNTKPDVDDDVSNESSDDVVGMLDFFASIGKTIKEAIVDLRDNVYVNEYIMGNFKHAVTEESDQTLTYVAKTGAENPTALNYEVEYVLNGKPTDAENFTATKWKIMAIRIPMNLIYLYTHTPERDVALSMATLLCAGIFAFLAPIVQFVILGIWAYAESEHDLYVMTRRKGKDTNFDNRVAFIKSPATFFYTVSVSKFKNLAVDAVNSTIHTVINSAIEGLQSTVDGYVDSMLSDTNAAIGGVVNTWTSDLQDVAKSNIQILADESEAYVQTVFDEFQMCFERIIIDTLTLAKNKGITIEEALKDPKIKDYIDRVDKVYDSVVGGTISDQVISRIGSGVVELTDTGIIALKNEIMDKAAIKDKFLSFTNKLFDDAKTKLEEATAAMVNEINDQYKLYADKSEEYLKNKAHELTSKAASIASQHAHAYGDVVAKKITDSLVSAVNDNISDAMIQSSPVDKFKFGYTDYLRLYLFFSGILNDDVKMQRVLDLININMKKNDANFDLKNSRVAYSADVSIDMDYLFIESLMNMWNETESNYVYRNKYESQYQY